MDRAVLEQHLAQIEGHVALGEGQVGRQRELVAKLARDGHSTVQAQELLALFERTQAAHIMHRDRLWRELEQKS